MREDLKVKNINDGSSKGNKSLLAGIVLILAGLLGLGSIFFFQKLKNRSIERVQESEQSESESEEAFQPRIDSDEGSYRYNYNCYNILLMGIDVSEEKTTSRGGQSDTILLLSMDKSAGKLSVINIPRDTMTEVKKYDGNGRSMGSDVMQITLQHAYGDGGVFSCNLMTNCVSELLYSIPIDGYCSITMDGISIINDSVGGVKVTLNCTIPSLKGYEAGDEILLSGEQACRYLRYRDTSKSGSSLERVERQNIYMQALLSAMKEKALGDSDYAVQLFEDLSDEMVTNLSITRLNDLQNIITSKDGYDGTIHTLEGEMVATDMYDEFYPDEAALEELILEIFYEKVENEE